MLRDRGRMKWTSMMLPEHVGMLREWEKEESHEAKRILDEQQLEEMNEVMAEAMAEGKDVVISYYEKRHYQLLTGKIHHYNELAQKLHIVDSAGQVRYIQIEDIGSVSLDG